MAQAGGADPRRAPAGDRRRPRAPGGLSHAQGLPDRPHRRDRPGALRASTPPSRPTIAARFGGRFIVRGGRYEAKEGPARARNAIIEFPDYASALGFYDDPDYRAVLPHALAGSEREIVIVEGVEERLMPAYWIAHVTVTDAEAYGRYAKLATGAIEAHGGRFLARARRATCSSRAATAPATCSPSSRASRRPRPATARPNTRRRSPMPAARPSATWSSSKGSDRAALPGARRASSSRWHQADGAVGGLEAAGEARRRRRGCGTRRGRRGGLFAPRAGPGRRRGPTAARHVVVEVWWRCPRAARPR